MNKERWRIITYLETSYTAVSWNQRNIFRILGEIDYRKLNKRAELFGAEIYSDIFSTD